MRMNDLLVAIRHSTSQICSTFVANLIATKFETCRTSMQLIRTSANVEGHLPLHYFNYGMTAIRKLVRYSLEESVGRVGRSVVEEGNKAFMTLP